MVGIVVAAPIAALVVNMMPMPQGQWEQIWTQPDVAVMYIDRESIAGPSELRTLATRTVYTGELPDGRITERIRTEEFDCRQSRGRLRRVTIVYKDGAPPRTIDLTDDESPWSAPYEADSLGAKKVRIACT